MLDIARIREQTDELKKTLASRNVTDISIDDLLVIDVAVRKLQNETETLRHELKQRSKGKPTEEERAALQELSRRIKEASSSTSDQARLATSSQNVPEESDMSEAFSPVIR